MINTFRRLLIRIGKVLPFIWCFIILINYAETIAASALEHFVLYDNKVILNTPISFVLNNYIEYDIVTLLVLTIISIAIETCIFNKLSCAYLGVNLVEKSYFDFKIEPIYIYVICIVNIAIASYLIYRGIKNIL